VTSRADIVAAVADALRAVTGKTFGTSSVEGLALVAFELDSLDLVEVAVMVEERFNIDIYPDVFGTPVYVSDLVDIIQPWVDGAPPDELSAGHSRS
jgi:acyl carrier protein